MLSRSRGSVRIARRAMGSRALSASGKTRPTGFIGLGNMGGHMAANLIKGGHNLVVFDLSGEAVERVAKKAAEKGLSARRATSPRQLAEECDTIVTMLPSSPHVQSVYSGDSGILKAVRKNALLIDSSTIDPTTARQVAASAASSGARMIDAPVSGGVGGAEAATLTFMVGGPEASFAAAKPVLELMGKKIVHCGDAGAGQIAKVANNLVLGISMIAVSEGMNLGVKLGIDPKKLADIINTSSGRCWSSDTYNPCPGVMQNVPSSRGYTGGFGVDLMKKDLGLAIQAAADAKTSLPMGAQAHALYDLLSKSGLGGKDFSIIYDYLAKNKIIA